MKTLFQRCKHYFSEGWMRMGTRKTQQKEKKKETRFIFLQEEEEEPENEKD